MKKKYKSLRFIVVVIKIVAWLSLVWMLMLGGLYAFALGNPEEASKAIAENASISTAMNYAFFYFDPVLGKMQFNADQTGMAITVVIILAVIYAIIALVMFYVIANLIKMFVDIEENTRATAMFLKERSNRL